MKLKELRDLIVKACENGFEDVDVDVVAEPDASGCGCPVVGIRCVCDNINGTEQRYVSVIES